jgi:hypothetical protein
MDEASNIFTFRLPDIACDLVLYIRLYHEHTPLPQAASYVDAVSLALGKGTLLKDALYQLVSCLRRLDWNEDNPWVCDVRRSWLMACLMLDELAWLALKKADLL